MKITYKWCDFQCFFFPLDQCSARNRHYLSQRTDKQGQIKTSSCGKLYLPCDCTLLLSCGVQERSEPLTAHDSNNPWTKIPNKSTVGIISTEYYHKLRKDIVSLSRITCKVTTEVSFFSRYKQYIIMISADRQGGATGLNYYPKTCNWHLMKFVNYQLTA